MTTPADPELPEPPEPSLPPHGPPAPETGLPGSIPGHVGPDTHGTEPAGPVGGFRADVAKASDWPEGPTGAQPLPPPGALESPGGPRLGGVFANALRYGSVLSGSRGYSAPRGRRRRDTQWMFTALPAFPLLLLVLRLWYLSRQDLQTMLLLVQNVSPLGLIGSLFITLIWVPPVFILAGRALGGLLLVSANDAGRSWLARTAGRTPGWVVLASGLLAGLTWQLRFLPTLVMLLISIAALDVRLRYNDRPEILRVTGIAIPLALSFLGLLLLGPAGLQAIHRHEVMTAFLLLAPVLAVPLLTGPVPQIAARAVTHWAAMLALGLAPILTAAIFVQAPVLPAVALELKVSPTDPAAPTAQTGDREIRVVRGQVITVDDRATTLLEPGGNVQFVPNGDVVSQVLCPDAIEPPFSTVTVHGWPVEAAVLSWLAPSRTRDEPDPRCRGRAVEPAG